MITNDAHWWRTQGSGSGRKYLPVERPSSGENPKIMWDVSNTIDRLVTDNRSNQAVAEGLSDMSAGPLTLQGKFMLDGAGEKIVDLMFPFSFMGEPPFLSFSGELKEGDLTERGSMPTVSVVVGGWVTQEMPPHGRLYTGARLAVVTTGVWYQKMMIHWNFTGTAIANPRYMT